MVADNKHLIENLKKLYLPKPTEDELLREKLSKEFQKEQDKLQNRIKDPQAPLQFANVPKLSSIFGPFSMGQMHDLVSVFKPGHQEDYLNPRLRTIADSSPKYLTRKLEAQLHAALLQSE